MKTPDLLRILLSETFTWPPEERIPEPYLIMDHPERAEAYYQDTQLGGVMTPLYLFFATQAAPLIRPGDQVLDLGPGPANNLSLLAMVQPMAHFTGLDLSGIMLQNAQRTTNKYNVKNVKLLKGDMSNLQQIATGSVDVVISSLALHHLPDFSVLAKTFHEITRVLKPGGHFCLFDFFHLRSEKTIRHLAKMYAHQTTPLMVDDYYHSLRAAFLSREIRQVANILGEKSDLRFQAMFYCLKSQSNGESALTLPQRTIINSWYEQLPTTQKGDFLLLLKLFRVAVNKVLIN